MLILWHAFIFLGLMVFIHRFVFFLGGLHCFFSKIFYFARYTNGRRPTDGIKTHTHTHFRSFLGDVGREFIQHQSVVLSWYFRFLFFATLCMRAVLMLFLGLTPLGFIPPSSFLLGVFHRHTHTLISAIECNRMTCSLRGILLDSTTPESKERRRKNS
jgi:hypothetical protein